MKNLLAAAVSALLIAHCSLPAAADGFFAGSETYVVTSSASATIVISNSPTSGGAAMPWYPAGILAKFRDSPTGDVLIVSHIRAGIVNRLVSTNTIAVSNVLYSSGTGSYSAIVWDPDGHYTVNPTNDSLRITTSSTNAEIILNRNIDR